MSNDTELHAILRMPPDHWKETDFAREKRSLYYIKASLRILQEQQRVARLEALLIEMLALKDMVDQLRHNPSNDEAESLLLEYRRRMGAAWATARIETQVKANSSLLPALKVAA